MTVATEMPVALVAELHRLTVIAIRIIAQVAMPEVDNRCALEAFTASALLALAFLTITAESLVRDRVRMKDKIRGQGWLQLPVRSEVRAGAG